MGGRKTGRGKNLFEVEKIKKGERREKDLKGAEGRKRGGALVGGIKAGKGKPGVG